MQISLWKWKLCVFVKSVFLILNWVPTTLLDRKHATLVAMQLNVLWLWHITLSILFKYFVISICHEYFLILLKKNYALLKRKTSQDCFKSQSPWFMPFSLNLFKCLSIIFVFIFFFHYCFYKTNYKLNVKLNLVDSCFCFFSFYIFVL